VLAAGLKRALQNEVFDEVRDHAVLALGRDDDQPSGARLGSLCGHQLDARGVDDRQQLFRDRLGRGKKSRPQPGRGHNRGVGDGYLRLRHDAL